MTPESLGVSVLIAVVAFLYASVGHGGASGYLAVLSFFAYSHEEMAATALILNVLVAGLAFYAYHRARHFSWRLTWPFIVTSIPAAFIGGLIRIPAQAYALLLAGTLLFAAWRLSPFFQQGVTEAEPVQPPRLTVALPAGAGIGLLSGIVGVGGGIFLSPLMLLMSWAGVKSTAATAAFFIVMNAIAGLLGRACRDALVLGEIWPFLIAGFVGGLLGSHLGASRFSSPVLRTLLSIVLLIAVAKLVIRLVP